MSEARTSGSPGTPLSFLYVADRKRACEFYRSALGCVLLVSDGHRDLVELGGARLRLTPVPDHVPSQHPVLGFHVADIEHCVAARIGRGIDFATLSPGSRNEAIWSSPDGAAKRAFFNDTEGNVLTLSEDA